jgi:hypothetical protein
MSVDNEWLWALAFCSVPFLFYALVETVAAWRGRRMEAIARRSKSRPLNKAK